MPWWPIESTATPVDDISFASSVSSLSTPSRSNKNKRRPGGHGRNSRRQQLLQQYHQSQQNGGGGHQRLPFQVFNRHQVESKPETTHIEHDFPVPVEIPVVIKKKSYEGDLVLVTVPEGKEPGDTLLIQHPSGNQQLVAATIPEGHVPGSTFRVDFPPRTTSKMTYIPPKQHVQKKGLNARVRSAAEAAEARMKMKRSPPRPSTPSSSDVSAGVPYFMKSRFQTISAIPEESKSEIQNQPSEIEPVEAAPSASRALSPQPSATSISKSSLPYFLRSKEDEKEAIQEDEQDDDNFSEYSEEEELPLRAPSPQPTTSKSPLPYFMRSNKPEQHHHTENVPRLSNKTHPSKGNQEQSRALSPAPSTSKGSSAVPYFLRSERSRPTTPTTPSPDDAPVSMNQPQHLTPRSHESRGESPIPPMSPTSPMRIFALKRSTSQPKLTPAESKRSLDSLSSTVSPKSRAPSPATTSSSAPLPYFMRSAMSECETRKVLSMNGPPSVYSSSVSSTSSPLPNSLPFDHTMKTNRIPVIKIQPRGPSPFRDDEAKSITSKSITSRSMTSKSSGSQRIDKRQQPRIHPSYSHDEVDDPDLIKVKVPPGYKAGDLMKFLIPDGRTIQAVVPMNGITEFQMRVGPQETEDEDEGWDAPEDELNYLSSVGEPPEDELMMKQLTLVEDAPDDELNACLSSIASMSRTQ